MRIYRSFTLVEILLTVAISIVVLGGVFTFLIDYSSDYNERIKRTYQQQKVRIIFDRIKYYVQQSNAQWVFNNTTLYFNITDNGRRIDFYIPYVYPDCCPSCSDINLCKDSQNKIHSVGEVQKLVKVRFRFDPLSNKLNGIVGNSTEQVVGDNLKDMYFFWDNVQNKTLGVNITDIYQYRRKGLLFNSTYNFTGSINLRNSQLDLSNETIEVEEFSEGEM